MANDSGNRGNMPRGREDQASTGSNMNRGTQSGTTSQMSDTQSANQQSSSGKPGSRPPATRPEDKLRNQPGGPGTGSSQYSNAGSTGTGSGQISPHNPASGQSSSAGRSSSGSSGSDRNT